jgi:hypothetical protein
VIERWKTFLAAIGLTSLSLRYDRAMSHGIDLEDWIAWALDFSPSPPLSSLPTGSADLALYVHRHVLVLPGKLSSLLATTPTLSNDEQTLDAITTPYSSLPEVLPHMQPSPLWMGWMETVQAGRVREVWDRVRLETAGPETPAKP